MRGNNLKKYSNSKNNNSNVLNPNNTTYESFNDCSRVALEYDLFKTTKSSESHLKRENANCIAMMFPFYIKASKAKKAVYSVNHLTKKSDSVSSYLTNKMRFYNYVIQNYGMNESNNSPLSEFIYVPFEKHEKEFKNPKAIGDILLEHGWISDTSSPHIYKKGNIPISISPNDIRLFISSSGVGIISLFFNIESNSKFEEYRFKLFFDEFKSLAKQVSTKDYISNLVKSYTNVEILFFEENHLDNTTSYEKRERVRAIFFCNLTCKKSPELPLIPLWITGHNTFKPLSSDRYEQLLKNRSSLAEGNTVDTTSEGCMILNSFDATKKGIKTYYEFHAQSFCQHMFVCYIIAQHQYFCLHNLTQLSANIADKKHFSAITLYKSENYIKSFALIRKNYSFNHISSVTKFQDTYEAIEKNLNIESFIRETNYTLEPIQLLAEKNIERKKAGILSILSSFTLLNTLVSIFTVILGEQKRLNAVFFAIIPTFLLISFLTFFVTPNRLQRTLVFFIEDVYLKVKSIWRKKIKNQKIK